MPACPVTVPALPVVSLCLHDEPGSWVVAPLGLIPVGCCSHTSTLCARCADPTDPVTWADYLVVVQPAPADAPPVPRFVVIPDGDGWSAVADLAAGSLVASSASDAEAAALAAVLNQPRSGGAATAPAAVLPVLF